MYVYIYDSFLDNNKYQKTLAKIETRVTDLGLNGKIIRLSVIKNIKDLIAGEIKRGVKALVAVGNDSTFSHILNSGDLSSIPLFIIPINYGPNEIANSLGIKMEEGACDILAARIIEKVDIGVANNSLFLSCATIETKGTILEIDNQYSMETSENGEINIINLLTNSLALNIKGEASDPKDGLLEIFIKTTKSSYLLNKKETGQSLIPTRALNVHNEKGVPLLLDGCLKINTPANISILKQKISLIVGKNRNFK